MEFVGHLDVPYQPEMVFDHLADMAELDRWNPNVTTSRRVSGDRLTVGSTYISTIERWPLRLTAQSTLTRVEPARSVTYEGNISGFWSVDSLRFEAHGGGTRITFQNFSRPPLWLRWLGPLLDVAFRPQAQRAVEGARRYLTQST
ncbi:MAG: SRPBCC family protein [Acidimicrobiia bacterium]|nr:SRPBCC family protein [Acidimicrobiia bacterium]